MNKNSKLDIKYLKELIITLRNSTDSKTHIDNFNDLISSLSLSQESILVKCDDDNIFRQYSNNIELSQWFLEQSKELLERYGKQLQVKDGAVSIQATNSDGNIQTIVGIRVINDPIVVAIFNIPSKYNSKLNELLLRVQLVSDLLITEEKKDLKVVDKRSNRSQLELLETLDLTIEVLKQEHFGSAVLMMVNTLASYLGSSFVSLGWKVGDYVKIESISNMGDFDHKTEHTRLLESCCEEALDQQHTLAYPDDKDSDFVLFSHRQLQQTLGTKRVISMPLRDLNGDHQAVILIGEDDLLVSKEKLDAIQVTFSIILPWLQQKRHQSRWWLAKLFYFFTNSLKNIFSTNNPWQKITVISMLSFILYISFAKSDFRLEATGSMTTDQIRQFGSPFDGYIDKIYVTLGDEVNSSEPLAQLDIKDLLLQESEIRAELRALKADKDKARVQNSLVDVEIANAKIIQTNARLKRVLQQIEQADVITPFSGIVIEGERKEMLGVPVRKGDLLFKLAKIEGLYGEFDLPESLIRYLKKDSTGEFVLLAKPDQRIPFTVETIIPIAQVKGQQGNHFIVKAKFNIPAENWWRPGMSGVARIDAGKKPLIWIWTHELIDNLKMRFWW